MVSTTNIMIDDRHNPASQGKINLEAVLHSKIDCKLDQDFQRINMSCSHSKQARDSKVPIQPLPKCTSEDSDNDDEQVSNADELLLKKLSTAIAKSPEGKRRLNTSLLAVASEVSNSCNIANTIPKKRPRYQRRNSFVVRRNHHLLPTASSPVNESFHESVPGFFSPKPEMPESSFKPSMHLKWGHASWSTSHDADWSHRVTEQMPPPPSVPRQPPSNSNTVLHFSSMPPHDHGMEASISSLMEASISSLALPGLEDEDTDSKNSGMVDASLQSPRLLPRRGSNLPSCMKAT